MDLGSKTLGACVTLVVWASAVPGRARTRPRDVPSTEITVHAGVSGCAVELDAAPEGKTDAQGSLTLGAVDPTDHYVHVRCPNQEERGYLVSPTEGQHVELQATALPAAPAPSGLEAAQAKIALRKLVLKAVEERAHGQFDDAVKDLHEAARMDPGNSDLHRELGITFLLAKDWKRARVEMLEALKHDPTDADAHNGLGYALDKLGETQAALEQYRAATHLDPDNTSYQEHYLETLAKLAAGQGGRKKQGP